MKLRQAKKLAVLLACCTVLSGAVIAAGASAAAAASESSLSSNVVQSPEDNKRLTNQVQAWIEELAKQPPFAAWSGAEFTIEPLGPGTHGWYVVITAGGQPVGYMIVNAKENGGYELGEYGAGKRPLFDVETLRLSLERQGIIPASSADGEYEATRLYASGLYAVWRVVTAEHEVLYADAATGDILPATEQQWTAAETSVRHQAAVVVPASAGVRSHVYKVHSRPSFDVYAELPWLTTKPIRVGNALQLLKPLQAEQPIRYVAQLYDRTATFMWGVVGYQQWSNDAVYLALEEPDPEGSGLIHVRYMSLASLQPFGFFYR